MPVTVNSISFKNEFSGERTDYLIGAIGTRITAYLDCKAEWSYQADDNNRIRFDGLRAFFVDADEDATGETWASYGFIEGDTIVITGTTSNNGTFTISYFNTNGLSAYFAASFTTETSNAGLITGTTEVTGLSYRYNLIENSASVDYNSLVDSNEYRYNRAAMNYAAYGLLAATQQGVYASNYMGTVQFEGYGRQFTDSVGTPFVFATAGDTITWADGNFIDRGIKVGDSLVVAGTVSNNGTKVITGVTATVLTTSTNLVNETSPGAATITRAAVLNRFCVEHSFDITPLYLDADQTDFLQDVAPDYFFNTSCLRYVFKLDMLYNLNDPNRLHTTNESEFLIGNTGWFNENYNGDNNYYVMAAPTFVINGNASTNADHLQVTDFSIVITNPTNTPFSNNNTQFVVGHFWLPEDAADYKNTLTDFETNFMFDRLLSTVGSAAVNGDNWGTGTQVLRGVTGTFTNSGSITIAGKLDLASALKTRITAATNKRYVIYVAVQNHTLDTEQADLVALKYTGALEYEPNYSNPLVGGNTIDFIEQYHADFSGLNAKPTAGNFIEDDVIARSQFFVDIANDALIDNINVVIYASHATYGTFELERRNISFAGATIVSGVQEILIETNRGFAQDEEYKGNEVRLLRNSGADVGTQKYYLLYYGFKLRWEYFRQLTGVSTQFFDTTEGFNGFNQNWQRYWATSGWTIYYANELVITENGFANTIDTEAVVTIENYEAGTDWSTDDIVVYRDSDNTDLGQFMITNEDMRVEATHTYIGGALPVIGNIEGELKIVRTRLTSDLAVWDVDDEVTVQEISTADALANPDGQLWVSVLGTNLLKKEFVAPDKFKFTANIDFTKLDLSAYGYRISSRIYPVIPLATAPCADGITIILNGTGRLYLYIGSNIGKNCTIYWGDGTTTAANGTGGTVTYNKTYATSAIYQVYICGDVDFIYDFRMQGFAVATFTDGALIESADLSNLGNSYGTMTYILMSYISTLANLIMPSGSFGILQIQIGVNTELTNNSVLTSLDLQNFSSIGSLQIIGMNALQTLLIDDNVITNGTNSTTIIETKLDKLFPFDNAFTPNGAPTDYRNTVIPNYITVANQDENVNRIYGNRAAFNNGVAKSFRFDGNNPIMSGTYQAPTGYIQADAVTVGNDGTPASPLEQLYVLTNQNNDNTVVKKYKWTFLYNS